MKKIMTFIYVIGLVFFMYMFQLFVIDNKELFGVKPNLILISVIVVSLWYGMSKGAIYGFIIGVITDVIFGNDFGMFTIIYMTIGLVIGALHRNHTRDNKMSLVYVTIIATVLFEIIEYIQFLVITGTYSSIFYLLKQMILCSILNIAIVYIIYGFVYKIIEYFEKNLKRDMTVF